MKNKTNIEEDIKIVNDFLVKMKSDFRTGLGYKEEIQAIENILADRERLEKENRKLTYARDWYFEHTVNKIVTPEMLHKILRTKYISRDEIEDKIRSLNKQEKEELKGTKGQDRYYIKQKYMYQRNILQELLDTEKEEI